MPRGVQQNLYRVTNPNSHSQSSTEAAAEAGSELVYLLLSTEGRGCIKAGAPHLCDIHRLACVQVTLPGIPPQLEEPHLILVLY